MDIISFLRSDLVSKLVADQESIKLKQQQASYNLFTISSYNSYLENFHSDIIASLLDPHASHHQSNRFLLLFFDYLNKFYQLNLKNHEYTDVKVTREEGRLDIWIRDNTSGKSIIIENKINNAIDMDNQIDRYYQYVTNAGFTVEAIIYLTIDGTKKAPPSELGIDHLIKNIEAYTKQPHDLIHGWLEICYNTATNQDSTSFLYQYIKLIKHLANRIMETNTMEELYSFISAKDGFKTLDTIIEMYGNITTYRADKFSKEITDYSPFRKQHRYKPTYWLYDNYLYKEQKLKLDIIFEENGGAKIVFWNVTTGGVNGRLILTERLNAINMLQEFTNEISYYDNGYLKRFIVGDIYKNVTDVDQAVIKFVKELMHRLNTL